MIKVQTGRGEVTISNAVFTAITGAAATNCFGVKGHGLPQHDRRTGPPCCAARP